MTGQIWILIRSLGLLKIFQLFYGLVESVCYLNCLAYHWASQTKPRHRDFPCLRIYFSQGGPQGFLLFSLICLACGSVPLDRFSGKSAAIYPSFRTLIMELEVAHGLQQGGLHPSKQAISNFCFWLFGFNHLFFLWLSCSYLSQCRSSLYCLLN